MLGRLAGMGQERGRFTRVFGYPLVEFDMPSRPIVWTTSESGILGRMLQDLPAATIAWPRLVLVSRVGTWCRKDQLGRPLTCIPRYDGLWLIDPSRLSENSPRRTRVHFASLRER